MMTGRRVLVTGASGFIGRAVVARLAAAGVHVTAATRGEPVTLHGVRHFRASDIGPDADWRQALTDCDNVVHLAARVHQMHDRAGDALAEFRRVNSCGTMALARQAAAVGVSRFVYVSSIGVNGQSTRLGVPFTEDNTPAPTDPYSVSKAEAEAQLLELAATGAMEVTIIRPPLVYGPGAPGNFFTMTRLLALGVPLPLGAVTGNRRSLVALDNLVSLLCVCLEHPVAANETFLVSDGEDLSTTDLLRRTAHALGVVPRLAPVPVALLQAAATLLGKGTLAQKLCGSLQVNAEKARRLLSWSPPVSVNEGLRRAVQPPASEMAI